MILPFDGRRVLPDTGRHGAGATPRKRGARPEPPNPEVRAISDNDQVIPFNPAFAYKMRAWLLATARDESVRDGEEAVLLAQEAIRLDDKPLYHDTLAAAYAEVGRFEAAIAEAERAIEMAKVGGQFDGIADYQTRLDLYRKRHPYRE